jgi:hypothetical protein
LGCDDIVDLLHQPDSFLEGDDDALVVGDILRGQSTAGLAARALLVLDGSTGKAVLQFTLAALVSAWEGGEVRPDDVR